MEEKVKNLINSWSKRNIQGIYCVNEKEALQRILEILPLSAAVGISGSKTLEQIGVVNSLESRGNKVFNQYKPGITREESLDLRRQGASADYYLTSANAVSEKGELVFFSGFGNRTSGIAYAQKVIVVIGVNKITPDLDAALKRAREYATPLNCKRLNWESACLKDGICRKEICLAPEYKRMCCQILIIETEAVMQRMTVIVVNEALGF